MTDKSVVPEGMNPSNPYDLGWNDGYAEGYACKLVDATTPFNPAAMDAPEMVERIADHVARKYSALFDRMSALGLARSILGIAHSIQSGGDGGETA